VTITKSITIDGTGLQGSILATGTNGIRINITDPLDTEQTVRIRRLSFNGSTPAEPSTPRAGILVEHAKRVSVEDVVIDGFVTGVSVAPSAEGVQLFIKDTVVRNNLGAGISVMAARARAGLSNVYLLFNGTALEATGGGTFVSYRNNVLFGNAKDGAPIEAGIHKEQ
jgi:hypothetical protein